MTTARAISIGASFPARRFWLPTASQANMVRFKNRWLLVEFLQPSQLAPAPLLTRGTESEAWRAPVMNDDDDGDTWSDQEDESYPHASSSKLPFMLPLPSSPPTKPILAGDAKTRQKNLSTYVRQSILETFGDDGHSKCSSLAGRSRAHLGPYSPAVSYFSPTTSLAILRISRDHYRLAWSAINLITEIEGIRVVPRVIAVSGTLSVCLLASGL